MPPIASCSICFEDLLFKAPQEPEGAFALLNKDKTESEVSATPCGHVFHSKCVSQWVLQKKLCPQCRNQVAQSDLVKLFLTEDQKCKSPVQEDRFNTFIVVPSSNNNNNSNSGGNNAEESRIIQDVLQCQLEDLEGTVQKLRKQVMMAEEQLNDKVRELSGLEADLLGSKRREEELEKAVRKHRRRSSLSGADESGLKKAYSALERDNGDLRNQLFVLRDAERKKDVEIREKTAKLEHLDGRIRRLESELSVKAEMITGLQSQIDSYNRLDYSIYESVDDLDPSGSSHHQGRRKNIKSCQNFCGCVKSAAIIAISLCIFLSIFVILPLKLFFVDRKDTFVES